MDVGATDASEVHLKQDIMRIGELRDRAVFKENILDTTKDKRVILLSRVSRSIVDQSYGPTRVCVSEAMSSSLLT